MKLSLGYFGSPDFSAAFLERILNDQELKKIIKISFVVTQPDRLVGRKQILTPTPVKKIANKYNLEILEIKKQEELNSKIKNLDLALVYAFSQIIPNDLLNQPKLGFWNIHPSLLPRFRGPSPIAYPLILGEKKTGITIFKMDEKIDHGPIIAQKSLTIKNDDYRTDLERKLTDLAFVIFKKIVLTNFKLKLTAQADNLATYTRLLKKDDGFIPFAILKKVFNNQAINFQEFPVIIKEYLNQYPNEKNNFLKKFNVESLIFNIFRGLSPWPGLWTILPNGKRLKIIEIDFKNNEEKKFRVSYSMFQIKTVQLEGKKPVNFQTFQRAYKVF